MSGAVQLEDAAMDTWQATGTDGAPSLQQVAADRLAAHRQRRAAAAAHEAEQEARSRHHRESLRIAKREDQRRGASLVRDAVLARYQQRESYREFLATEAERAIAQAQAEAEVAARTARAVAETQMALLEELEAINRPEPGPREEAIALQRAETRDELAHALADIVLGARELMQEPGYAPIQEFSTGERLTLAPTTAVSEPAVREVSAGGLTVRLFEDMPATPPRPSEVTPRRGSQPLEEFNSTYLDEHGAAVLSALEEEIDFRRAPEFPQASVAEMHSIPGNLIEFPRELIAPRRARPRLAEGPMTDDPSQEPQLRIFEVDAEQAAPEYIAYDAIPAMPEWQSLQLSGFEAEPSSPSSASDAQTHLALPLYTAPLERRLMSAAVDLCCVGTAWLASLACVSEVAGPGLRALPLPLVAVSALGAFAVYMVLYQVLFFTLNDGTPGMRYARIALCTFGESNPSRRAMRGRVFSFLLALCPMGLGLAWALLDNDKLGWHDRMSRMYQRAY